MKKFFTIVKKTIALFSAAFFLFICLIILDKACKTNILTPHLKRLIHTEKTISSPPLAEDFGNFTPNEQTLQTPTEQIPSASRHTYVVGNLPSPHNAPAVSPLYTKEFWRSATTEDIIKELENGTNLNARNANGQTILMSAAFLTRNPQHINLLLEYGSDITARDIKGRTALMYAAANPNPQIARNLIIAGAKTDAEDINGWQPLMYAAAHNSNPRIIDVFTARGANINSKIPEVKNTYQRASLPNQFIAAVKIALRSTQKLLSDLYTSLGEEDSENLVETTEKVLDEMADEILGKNIDMTPLMLACAYNQSPEMVAALIEKGADIKAYDKKGKSAVDYAAQNPNINQTDIFWKMNNLLYD